MNKQIDLFIKEIKFFPYTTIYVVKFGDNELTVKRSYDNKLSCVENIKPEIRNILISLIQNHITSIYTQSDY